MTDCAGRTLAGETSFWIPQNFLALPEEQSRLATARAVVLPVPYDGTTSHRGGARGGPRAIIEASYNLEDYDHELGVDVAEAGIYTAPALEPHMDGPRHMADRVRQAVTPFVRDGKLVALLGGEHSVTIGHVEALAEKFSTGPLPETLSVLFLDAHADLRDRYMGTQWGHASVARRLSEICPVVQAGVRSVSLEEVEFIRAGEVRTVFWPPGGAAGTQPEYMSADLPASLNHGDMIDLLSRHVYVSVDLDVLDPSIMPAVGTPEPGGMGWYDVISLLRAVAEKRHIVGLDVTELSPSEGPPSCAYTAAKLVYKLLAYSLFLGGRALDSDSSVRE